MKKQDLPVSLQSLIKSEDDLMFLVQCCDERYTYKTCCGKSFMSENDVRDLEIVRMRFRDRMTYAQIGAHFGLSHDRPRQICECWLCGARHPNTIRKLQERNASTKRGKIILWNKRVQEITEITGD